MLLLIYIYIIRYFSIFYVEYITFLTYSYILLFYLYKFSIFRILETNVECISSIEEVDIPIPEGEEASSSVNPYPCDFCSRRFNRKSHLMNHMVTHQSERPFCCALCGVRYRRKCDLANHMKIHIGPDNQLDNGKGNNKIIVYFKEIH